MVSEEDLENADKWFARWGDWAAFISRLLPIVRTFISFPAGVTRIKFGRFLVFTFLGSFIWCGLLALGGYYLGANWEELRRSCGRSTSPSPWSSWLSWPTTSITTCSAGGEGGE